MQRLNIRPRVSDRWNGLTYIIERKVMHYVLVVLMAILGAMFPGFLVKAIKSTDKNEADGALFGARVILGMLMLIVGMFLDAW